MHGAQRGERIVLTSWVGPLCALVGAVVVAMAGPVAGARAAAPPVDARTLFLQDCATCHGADAKGTARGPSLEGVGRASVDFMLTTGRMPLPHPDSISRRQPPKYDAPTIRALEDYVQALVPGGPEIPLVDPAGGDLAGGGEIFRAQCAACHQWSGDGGALLRRESPALGGATPVQVAEAVRTGPGQMPVFPSAAISTADLQSLTRYVDDLKHPEDRGGQSLWHLGPVAEGAMAMGVMVLLAIALRHIGERR
jgi:ubiquinol-cytochrome c reductase cytochrome c subunit